MVLTLKVKSVKGCKILVNIKRASFHVATMFSWTMLPTASAISAERPSYLAISGMMNSNNGLCIWLLFTTLASRRCEGNILSISSSIWPSDWSGGFAAITARNVHSSSGALLSSKWKQWRASACTVVREGVPQLSASRRLMGLTFLTSVPISSLILCS